MRCVLSHIVSTTQHHLMRFMDNIQQSDRPELPQIEQIIFSNINKNIFSVFMQK